MDSPYFLHSVSNNISVVRSRVGFNRTVAAVLGTMGLPHLGSVDPRVLRDSNILEGRPEWVILNDLLLEYDIACEGKSRRVVFLVARYEWDGFERFQRVIVLDMTERRTALPL